MREGSRTHPAATLSPQAAAEIEAELAEEAAEEEAGLADEEAGT